MGKVGRQNWSEKLKNWRVGKEIKLAATWSTSVASLFLILTFFFMMAQVKGKKRAIRESSVSPTSEVIIRPSS